MAKQSLEARVDSLEEKINDFKGQLSTLLLDVGSLKRKMALVDDEIAFSIKNITNRINALSGRVKPTSTGGPQPETFNVTADPQLYYDLMSKKISKEEFLQRALGIEPQPKKEPINASGAAE